jgi:hypothetical protein
MLNKDNSGQYKEAPVYVDRVLNFRKKVRSGCSEVVSGEEIRDVVDYIQKLEAKITQLVLEQEPRYRQENVFTTNPLPSRGSTLYGGHGGPSTFQGDSTSFGHKSSTKVPDND